MPVSVENVDKAIAPARHVVMLSRILHCVSDKEIAVDVLDAEGRKPSRNLWISKIAVNLSRCRRSEAGRPIGGEYVDRSGPKVRRKEKDAVWIGSENQTFVDRACRVIDGEDRLISRGQTARPSCNSSILGVPDECGRAGRARHEKCRGRVPHEAGRSGGGGVRAAGLRVPAAGGGDG